MKKAVIYARFSSHSQTEQSIEGQLRVCNEYAKANDIVIVDTYIDRAKTAQNDNRPQFQQMLLDSENKEWDYVIVYALDRFARDDGDYGADKKHLRQNGVKLLSATEIIGTNADGTENLSGILTEGILVAVAKYYSRELAKKVRRGQKESLEKQNFMGGTILYGYCVDNKKLVINENEASVIRDIYNMYASGKTADDIVRILKEKNIKNRFGRFFCKNSIMNMLKNKRYIGFFKYGENEIPNYHPAIIDEDLFNVCAEKITRRKRSIDRFELYGDYLLSGKLYCGKCLTKMYGESGTSKTGKLYHYYKCFNRKKNDGCSKKNIAKDYLEDVVMAITMDNLLHEDIVLDLIDNAVSVHNKEIKEDKELVILKKQLSENEKFIKNLLNAIKNGIYTESTQTELQTLEKEKKETLNAIALKESKLKSPLEREQVLYFLKQFMFDKNTLTKEEKSQIINLLIEMVILYEDRVVVVFKNGDNSGKPLKIEDIIDQISSKKGQFSPPHCSFSNSGVKVYFTQYYIIIERRI